MTVRIAIRQADIFNTPIECGLRSAALLLAAYPAACDLQRLVQYDYLIVHTGDIEGGPPSIHPATPYRSNELLVRRPLVETGLDYMTHRRVIVREFSSLGISYAAGEYAAVFVGALTSSYAALLSDRAAWVIARFQSMNDNDLHRYMQARWSRWGSEFLWAAMIEETD